MTTVAPPTLPPVIFVDDDETCEHRPTQGCCYCRPRLIPNNFTWRRGDRVAKRYPSLRAVMDAAVACPGRALRLSRVAE